MPYLSVAADWWYAFLVSKKMLRDYPEIASGGAMLSSRPDVVARMTDPLLADSIRCTDSTKISVRCDVGHIRIIAARTACHAVSANSCAECWAEKGGRQGEYLSSSPELVAKMVSPELADSILCVDRKRRIEVYCDAGHIRDVSVGTATRRGTATRAGGLDQCRECEKERRLGSSWPPDRNVWLGNKFPNIADELADQSLRFKLSPHAARRVEWVCRTCSRRWATEVHNRTSDGSGCPSCAAYGFDPSQPGTLYVLDATTHIVFGITGNLDQRLKTYDDSRVLLHRFDFEVGGEARRIETAIKREFKDCRYTESELPGEVSESLTLDCLADLLAFIAAA